MTSEYHEPAHKVLSVGSTLRTALSYAQREIPVFPLRGKEPLTPRGFKDATTDPRRIHMLWTRHPGANIGMPTGSASGLVVVDRDGDSPEAMRIWNSLPPTVEVTTSRGKHRYYRIPSGAKVSSRKLAPDLDLKADGGYVVAPPSVHPNGARYEFVQRTRSLGIATLPDELLEPEPRVQPSRRREIVDVDDSVPIHEGVRNQTLFFMALDLKDSGRGREEALGELVDINQVRCVPPLEESEVEAIVKSAYRYPIRGRRTPPEVLEALASLKRAWWATAWRGVGGKSDRDIIRTLIRLAERYGQLVPAGVRISISWRVLAIAAGCKVRTVARVIKRLRLAGWLRGDNAERSGTDSGAFVLLPRPTVITSSMASRGGATDASSGDTLSRLPELTPCFRHRGFVGKGKAGALYVLEVFGPQNLEELAEYLGFRRPRDLRRLYLDPLAELGLIEDRGGVYALPGRGRYVRRVEEIRAAPHGGGSRKVRGKDQDGRRVTRVVEVPPMSEVERDEADRLEYERQRAKHRKVLAGKVGQADPTPERTTSELERVPDPDPAIRDALREYLRSNPHRRDEYPSWLANTLWAFGLVEDKPPLAAVELALADLEGKAA